MASRTVRLNVGDSGKLGTKSTKLCWETILSLKRSSIILTSNKTFGEMGQVFGDEVLASAILDRLLHHAELVAMSGPCYRLKDRMLAEGGQATKSS